MQFTFEVRLALPYICEIRYTSYIYEVYDVYENQPYMPYMTVENIRQLVSIRIRRICSQYTDKCRIIYGQWYTAYHFD